MNRCHRHAPVSWAPVAFCCFVWFSSLTQKALGDEFIRGDVSTDGKIGITDAAILGARFSAAGVAASCDDAMDIDDSGDLEINDFALLVEFLTELSETTHSFLEDPFPFPGTDDSPDPLDCQVGSGSDPGSMDRDYIFDWDVPSQSGFVPGTEIDIFLEVSLPEAINGFSIAYRLNTNFLNLVSVDFMGVDMTEGDRVALEASPGFSWSLAGRDANGFSLLLVATILTDNAFEPIDFSPTQGPVNEFRLLHLRASVRDIAPAAGTIILEPFSGSYVGIADTRGTVNEVSTGPPFMQISPFAPAIPVLQDSSEIFFRGDSNADAFLDISDGVHTLVYLFQGGPEPKILDAADSNDDGIIDISDPSYTLSFLFQGTTAPPPPFATCGTDPTVDFLIGFQEVANCTPKP